MHSDAAIAGTSVTLAEGAGFLLVLNGLSRAFGYTDSHSC
jgi:hypothetical protein